MKNGELFQVSTYEQKKKSNVLSRNLLSKTVQKQYDNLHKAQKRRVNPPKKNADTERMGLKDIPNATENERS